MLRLFILLATLVTHCGTVSATWQQAPTLKAAFDDRFSADPRSQYQTKGDLSWESGLLSFSQQSSILRDVSSGAWAEVQVNLAAPVQQRTTPLDFRVWFILNGATDCCLRITQEVVAQQAWRLAVIDTGEGRTADATVVREIRTDLTAPARITVTYRHGLIRVSADSKSLLTGYIANGTASVTAIKVAATNELRLSRLAVSTSSPPAPLTPSHRRELERARAGYQKMARHHGDGQFAEAVKCGEASLTTTRDILGEYHPDYMNWLNNLSVVLLRMGDFDRAISVCGRAGDLRRVSLGEDHPEVATSMSNLAAILRESGDYERATSLTQQALKTWGATLGQSHPKYTSGLNNLAVLYQSTGDFTRAESLMLDVLNIDASTPGAEAQHATSLANLASLYKETGQYRAAYDYYARSLKARRRVHGDHHPFYAESQIGMAALNELMGDYAGARRLYQDALETHKRTRVENHPMIADALHSLGRVSEQMGEESDALGFYERAKAIRASTIGKQHRDYALSLAAIAGLCARTGDHARAFREGQEAVRIAKATLGENHPQYAACLNILGCITERMGRHAETRPLLERAADILRASLGAEHPDYLQCLANLARVYSRVGNSLAAEPLLMTVELNSRARLDDAAIVQSERQQRRMQSMARPMLDSWLSHAIESAADPTVIVETVWRWKGAVTFRQHVYRQAVSLPPVANVFEELQLVSRQLSLVASQRPVAELGAAEAEQAKIRNRAELWNDRFLRLTRRREELERQVATMSDDFDTLSTGLRVSTVQSRLSERTVLVDVLEYEHTRFGKPLAGGNVTSERRYVACVVTRNGVSVAPLGPAAPIKAAIASFRERLSTDGSSSADWSRLRSSGQRLRELVWLPIEKHLDGANTVILSPDTAIASLPLSALPGRKTGSYLIEEYRLGSIPFSQLLLVVQSRKKDNSLQDRVLVIGDVDYGQPPQPAARERENARKTPSAPGGARTDWVSLSGFTDELEVVRNQCDVGLGGDVTVLRGAEATESRFMAELPAHGILHVITHGFFASRRDLEKMAATPSMHQPAIGDNVVTRYMPGLLSGLVLAGANRRADSKAMDEDGILTAAEIEAIGLLSIELAVLSACETGLGQENAGEGLLGLQRAFHIAGARSVVGSLWKVDDRATLALMQRFYENLWIRKQSRLDSLRNAQLHILRNSRLADGTRLPRGEPIMRRNPVAKTGEAHRTAPFFWAAWTLSGDWGSFK